MIRSLALALLLVGCSTPLPVPPTFTTACPPRVAVPAGVRKHPTRVQADALEIRVELSREAERARGDACAAANDERDEWIKGLTK